MAYETKVILTLLAQQIAQSKNIREAYGHVARAANVEGVRLPAMDDLLKQIEDESEDKKKQGDKHA